MIRILPLFALAFKIWMLETHVAEAPRRVDGVASEGVFVGFEV